MFLRIGIFSLALAQLSSVVLGTPISEPTVERRAPSKWVHPGVMVDKAQLDFVKEKVNAGEQPWKDAYSAMLKDKLASKTRKPSPTATVECGPTSKPDIGCSQEKQDALAAYANSLAWYISGEKSYAQQAITIMNAYAKTIKAHTNSNAQLQTGWAGATWARVGEIIRYSNAGWAASDITAFENMLRNVYLKEVIGGSNSNGNWELVMMEAAVGIAVFLEDSASYDKAMKKYLSRVPAYVYLTSDGKLPKVAAGQSLSSASAIEKYWQGQSTFPVSGIAQETCRDFVHTGYGISSISHVAETSRIQGTDLYSGDIGQRLQSALEFHSNLELGAAQPSWLCKGKSIKRGLGPVTEVGYNALATRMNKSMDSTGKLTMKNRPAGTDLLFVGWETLTHAQNTA